MLYVENLPSIDIPEIIRVELPQDDSVVITGVTEADVPAKVSRQFTTCISTFYTLFLTLYRAAKRQELKRLRQKTK